MGEKEYVAVWKCENPVESHEMGRETVGSLEELTEKFSPEDPNNCDSCRDYNDYYLGTIDRVEVYEDGDKVDVIEQDDLIDGSLKWDIQEE